MRRKRKHYKHDIQREKVRWEDPQILQTLLREGLKMREIKSWYFFQFISEISIWTMAEKKQEQSETRVPTYMSNFIPFM